MTDAIVPEIVGKVVLAAAVAVLAISNAVVYRKYRRAVEACGRADGKRQDKAQRWTTAASEGGPKADAGGSGTGSGAKAEGTVGSSGTFADLCEDRQDGGAKGAADKRD